MAIQVNQDNFQGEVLGADSSVLVDFYSDSCVPCKQYSLTLEEVENDLKDQIKIVKVNAISDQDLTIQYKVMAVPTTIIFKDGRERDRIVGIASKEELIEKVKAL